MARNFDFTRSAWFIPCALLNALFLGTSHVLSYFPLQWAAYEEILATLSTVFDGDIQRFYDFASIVLTLSMACLVYLAFIRQGRVKAVLRTFQICSIAIVPLGVEIFLFDYPEWNLHVTRFQSTYSIMPWFTNADLFFSTSGIFVATTLLLLLSKHKSNANATARMSNN